MSGGYVSAEALRGYVIALRAGREITQQQLADAIRMAKRTYISWETGDTKDIKTPYLVRAIKYLGGSFDQVAEMGDEATREDGALLAEQWLSKHPQVRTLIESSVRYGADRERLAIGLEVVAGLVRKGLVSPNAIEQLEDLLSDD